MTHVLLVEPDLEDRRQLRQLLENGGFAVKEVTPEDLAEPFDISDVLCVVSSSAPHSDGYSTVLDVAGSVPVILVTHEANVAAYAHRIVRFRDGVVESDEIKPRFTAATTALAGDA